MIPTLTWILLGAILGALFVAVASKLRQLRSIVAAGLVVAAAIYVGFAAIAAAGATWLAIESFGVLLYGAFAWLGLKRSAGWLALGWALHVGWDVGLHQLHHGSVFTPSWYPPLCTGFDLAVAGLVVVSRSRANRR
jgi:hypothetical protein